jgi:hypothetical protein
MSDFRLVWTLTGAGWADCAVADHEAEAVVVASYITAAPEDLLTAVARIVSGESEIRVEFEAEPTEYRWIFYRQSEDVWIPLLELPNSGRHDNAGTEIWSSWQTVDTVARTAPSSAASTTSLGPYGESRYHGKWRSPFPRAELEALRRLWRDRQSATSS